MIHSVPSKRTDHARLAVIAFDRHCCGTQKTAVRKIAKKALVGNKLPIVHTAPDPAAHQSCPIIKRLQEPSAMHVQGGTINARPCLE
jgi:hypothetical protein